MISGRWSSLEKVGAIPASLIRSGRSTKARSRRLYVPFCIRVAVLISCVRASVSATFFSLISNGVMGEWLGALSGSQQFPALQSPTTVTKSGKYF